MNSREWTLEDDLKLLDGIQHCGYGNWTAISATFTNRAPTECFKRYLDKFIIKPENEDLKVIATDLEKLGSRPELCTNCNLSVPHKTTNSILDILKVENSLRELENADKLVGNDDLSRKLNSSRKGRIFVSNITCDSYNPCRSEFDVEYDDKAENLLELLREPPESIPFDDEEDNELIEQLELALVDSYNMRLKERIKRKKIIRDHGLIDMRKTYSMSQRLKVSFGSSGISSLFPFIKFLKGPVFDFLVEKLLYEKELRSRINYLMTYRGFGIRFLNGILTYERLNKKRLRHKESIGYNGTPLLIETGETRNLRRPTAPLALYNLPGFHLLEEDEKNLCSTARIVPQTYYSFKQLLISECHKHNGLKLAQARHLIKIDVNKTRKMYDHLISTGDIWNKKK